MSIDKQNTNLYDLYFDHCCTIVDTKDVLKTDISGKTPCGRFKRWWYGLFLLSHNDYRCVTYFKSSNALRMERIRQFRSFRDRIHPLSKFRNTWDFTMFTIFVVELFSFHHNSSLTFGHISRYFYYLGAICDLFILVDIFVNLMTGFIDKEHTIVLEKQEGWLHYGSTRLFLHATSAIPLHCILILRYGTDTDCTFCKTNKFVATLTLLSTFRLFRLFETSHCLTRERENHQLTFFLRFFRVYVLGTFAMIQYININDVLQVIKMIYTNRLDDNSYIMLIYDMKYKGANLPSNVHLMILNYMRVGKSILLYKFGSGITESYLDKAMTLVGVVIIHLFYLFILLELYSYITRLFFPEQMLVVKQNATENLVSSHQLPEMMIRKTRKYFKYNQAQMKVIENHNSLYRSLPDSLKKEIFKATHLRLITRVPCFAEWPIVLLEDILELMREEIYLKDDMVAESGVSSEGLLVVATGELVVYGQDGNETGHLIDGDYFGELSLVTDNELRVSSVVALSPCLILILEKMSFRRYMRQRPGLFYLMKKELTKKYTSNSYTPQYNNDTT